MSKSVARVAEALKAAGLETQIQEAGAARTAEEAAVACGCTLDQIVKSLIFQGESGQLYGSVSARDIQEALKDEGYKVERSQVLLDQPIKVLGTTEVRVALHPEVSVMASVTVARSLEEAERVAAADLLEDAEEASEAEELEAEAEDYVQSHEDE